MGVFIKTIIPLALVGYEMVIANAPSWTTSFPGLFPLNLGGAGKDPGIGWSRDSKHPKILGVINYDVMNV